MTDTVEKFVEQATNPGNRFMFGIPRLDLMIRGIGRGELCIVTGRAHSSKTQLLLNAVVNNPERRIVWFTPDEVAELVMIKLVTIVHQLDPEQLERDVKAKVPETLQMLGEFAATSLPNLLIVDRTADIDQMDVALTEAEEYWGGPADAVVFDFLELLPGDGDARGVQRKADQLKQFGSDRDVPMLVVHQTGRSGDRGVAMGMDGMKYGGEQQATFVIEVLRKRDNMNSPVAERELHECTSTLNVAKNKRPPCHTGEIDVYLDPKFGTMRTMEAGDPGTPLAGHKYSHNQGAPDRIRTQTPTQADDYRQQMGYDRIHPEPEPDDSWRQPMSAAELAEAQLRERMGQF